MKYLSTRGDRAPRGFSDILLEGLAPDGGLYLPTHYPRVDAATLARWRALPYAGLALEILSLYIDDIAPADLARLVRATYTEAVFGTPQITPLRRLDGRRTDGTDGTDRAGRTDRTGRTGGTDRADCGDSGDSGDSADSDEGASPLYLQQLSNGPTLAFKDVAMQLLGRLFEFELARRGADLNILGATSGDTGSAAEYALRGKRGVRVFMLSPHGRMSAFQQAQMFSLQDANIHNLAVDGVFDDCQDIVKAVSADLDFKRRHRIGTVNSINWARLLAQVVYYFHGWLRATDGAGGDGGGGDARVSFAVPSGNFGNICAGHVARQMGLPIHRLVLATNENNVLDEFFRTGTYRVRGGAETFETSSPSMDISKASNFERFVFDLLGRDERAAARTAELFGPEMARHGSFTLTRDEFARLPAFGFVSGCSTHADRLATIRDTWQAHGVLVDTHTADGLTVARAHRDAGVPMVVLETAQPAKFADTVREALGPDGPVPEVPPALRGIERLPRRFERLPADAAAVRRYIERHDGAGATA